MAIWQFSIELIPKSWAVNHQHDASLFYGTEGYDTEIAWKNSQTNPKFKEVLSKVLPPAVSWHEDLLCWGNELEHDIQVWYENNTMTGISIRLDLNQNLNNIIVKVVTAAMELDCDFFFPEFKLITDANEFELQKLVRKSKAAQYVKDPQGFFDKL